MSEENMLDWTIVYQATDTRVGANNSEVTYRAEVPGGWIYRHTTSAKTGTTSMTQTPMKLFDSMVFVPDPKQR